ncbi:FAD-binding and (Fe-S)-binding domain-containing protein [Brevibacterium moorei]|uniref:FAD-binding and (Fe-S)-binding domain-containing protein n=1 Tax=Brevibacterium moorei TaxID=2968457 RepID=UPI00211CA8C8|nr:FAD-binding and (Fe-S)-binding domain-containing protein [Brevibacterium sp. 68QC2CO]MCQ9386868.1 FAD-binding oxidoreductase [Brevibacterium sp. 68QC2CO]
MRGALGSDIKRGLARPVQEPMPNRASTAVLDARGSNLVASLRTLLQVTGDEAERTVLDAPHDLVRYSSDASPYRLMPKVVVLARGVDDVVKLLRWARETGHGVTFRAGGTSLNGQSQSDDVLVDVRRHWTGAHVLDDGARIQMRPGTITARANAMLFRHGRKLGPDPASSGAAAIGGVVANNASGMTCGVQKNSYYTLESATLVLASGTVVDTGAADADERLREAEPELVAGLLAIREDLLADQDLVTRIRSKFSIKNTSGYHLDAFLDSDSPAQILRGLSVGSEGTLSFIADTVFRTVPFGRSRTTAFFRFPTLQAAAATVAGLNEAGAEAVELMDAASLRAAASAKGAPAWIAELAEDAQDAVVLTEIRADDEAELAAFEDRARAVVGLNATGDAATGVTGDFTRDAKVAAGYWSVRSGLLAIIGAARPHGTSLITEDVVVPPAQLAEACTDLQQLLVKHGFLGAVNGHASAGNLHFYLYLDATREDQVTTYRAFMEDLVDVIVDRYDGSLKGEHGTGRNMAPYIEREWGTAAIGFMKRTKALLDPAGLLGPGVFLNDDPEVAFENLKTMPVLDSEFDRCIECGFCEPVCPSRNITVTPRQRIVLQREMARQGWDGPVEQALVDSYEYHAVNTCAGDSSCAIACPVGIDTGHVMKEVRRDSWSPTAQKVGEAIAAGWGATSTGARLAVGAANLLTRTTGAAGDKLLGAVTKAGRAVAGDDLVPNWLTAIPGTGPRAPHTDVTREQADVVLFPACINRIFGAPKEPGAPLNVTEALIALAERAGKKVWIPEDLGDDCCATIWQSKGLDAGNRLMAARVVEDLHRWSDGGRLPVIVDAASCTLGVLHEVVPHLDAHHKQLHDELTILDAMTWVNREVVPELGEHEKLGTVVVHPTCSMHNMDIAGDLLALAGEAAQNVVEPIVATCCATAGDRGMLHPELTETATEEEQAEVAAVDADAWVSGNRTCELGMEHDTGKPYESVIVTLERVTR